MPHVYDQRSAAASDSGVDRDLLISPGGSFERLELWFETELAVPGPHDVGREHRLLVALAPSPVPVPRPLALCDDATVIGAPFLVMRYVDGEVLRSAPAAAMLDLAGRRRVSDHLVDVLAALHDVDVDAVGLGDLAAATATSSDSSAGGGTSTNARSPYPSP